MPQQKKILVLDVWQSDSGLPLLVEFHRLLSDAIAEIPAEHLAAARVDIGGDDDGARFQVSYTRPETETEMNERCVKEAAAAVRVKLAMMTGAERLAYNAAANDAFIKRLRSVPLSDLVPPGSIRQQKKNP